ncbi:MAG: COG1361 S-layer family protein [Nanoarchaeota archaeon]
MRPTIVYILALLLLAAPALAATLPGVDITATFLNQDPDPVGPNRYVDLRWRIENLGSDAAPNIDVEILPQYPFSLEPGESGVKAIGTMLGRQMGDLGVVVKYRLYVDSNAVPGTDTIKLRYRTNGGNWEEFPEFAVSVESQESILAIDQVEMTPQSVEPGQTVQVSIKVRNIADALLRNIKVNLDIKALLQTATSITYEELPFTPVDSTNEKVVKSLKAGEQTAVVFSLMVDPTASPKVYKLPIVVHYTDDYGRNTSRTFYTSMVVTSKPSLAIQLEKADLLTANSKGKVIVKFINKGLNRVKFLDATIGTQSNYDLLSAKESYIGNIDSDDYETLEIELFVKPDGDKLVIPVAVSYMDENNNAYQQSKDIEVRLYTAEEIGKLGLKPKSSLPVVLIVIALVVVGIIIFRLTRRKKRS